MKLSRELVKSYLRSLYAENFAEDDEYENPAVVDTMSDDILLTAYCGSGLFQDNHPELYEEDIEGLE